MRKLRQPCYLFSLFCVWTGLVGLAGCAASRVPSVSPPISVSIPVQTTGLSCEQANRIAYRIVKEGGYLPTSLTLASASRQGMITGVKSRGEIKGARTRPAGEDTVRVRVTCGTGGVRAVGDYGKGADSMNTGFPEYFAVRFSAMAEVTQRDETPPPPDQTQVVITPLTGCDGGLELWAAVQAVFPVRIGAVNTTDRTYVLEADQIMLVTPAGEQIAPLVENGGTFPVPALLDQTLIPGAQITGYLYYSAGSYTGARGFLVEKESKEREGFSVQF